MTAAPRRAFVVSHTHWDREWYLTFPRFRVQLLETVDAVLDLLGLTGSGYQSLYHFTVGKALPDSRIQSDPPYAERGAER